MTDTARRERELSRELAKIRSQRAAEDRAVRKNRDFSLGGLPPDTTHKAKRGSADTPDVVELPV